MPDDSASSRRAVLGGSLAVAGLGLLPAEARSVVRPDPQLRQLVDAERDGILLWQVGALSYVAEEYVLSGRADVFESMSMADAVDMSKRDSTIDFARRDFRRTLVQPAQPYATRLIVYRPADWRRFSGRVLLEVLHPSRGGSSSVWARSNAMLAREGDAFVGIQPPLTLAGLRSAAPARYAALHAVHPTQLWDAIIDTAIAARRRGPTGLLPGAAVRQLVLAGYSYTGVATADFANFDHHRARQGNGRPLIDGYLPMASATFVRPLDVPVIRVNTQSEFNGNGGLANRNADSDARVGRMRHYEVAGAAHVDVRPATPALPPRTCVPEAPELQRFSPEGCQAAFPTGSLPNDYPVHLVVDAALANMSAWIEGRATPPRAERIAVDARGQTLHDADGNAAGGLRLTPVAVPAAAYGVGTGGCRNFGCTAPMTAARRRALYGSGDAYVARAGRHAQLLVRQRLVLPEAAAILVADAREKADF